MAFRRVNYIVTNHLLLKDDPLFTVIKRNKVTNSLAKEIAFLNHCAAILALVSATIGLMSIFYEAKAHLQIMGFASIFHICGSIGIESYKKRKNRYLLLLTGLCNVAFFGVSQVFLILFILVADAESYPSKRDFNSETFFHVILIPWILLSIIIELMFLILIIYLAVSKKILISLNRSAN
ncbi:uncharacterized protein LOC128394831 [Panonychus citri]|uniref:uncharacterized protein LOC128389240 n=1 Tax=Panonychus citri TaxID=50023 RepID=UPI00230741CA|nr:uncharacterized protein LOC128389240 [Panonychus citri]XP_053210339.1 uncharacterized protein LOC128394110 [Panonychus citri]XP_053211176.1 uncharacterized protein LOC128394831 [Panonychus citri]